MSAEERDCCIYIYIYIYIYARNKVKIHDNKARTQPNSRTKMNPGSITMNDNIGLA